jgi:hypothetical protein
MATIEFFDPCGRLEVKQPHAPRLDSLVGKRVGFVSNEQWQAYRMLPRLKSLLERDWAGIEVLPIDAFPQGNAPHRGKNPPTSVSTPASPPHRSGPVLVAPFRERQRSGLRSAGQCVPSRSQKAPPARRSPTAPSSPGPAAA